ncbi:uncharacterized protein LOC106169383 [Lingula anatina]|uniref:Uncharacterized protein LOC106169383 n=1 Tax=Lingula anatina TaxID=7574 RepID=A0A1S3J1I9_LINAN|nr:uncharacterized protein LOC106169383 [Lingula anatina]XP_013404286.1 uncharacterized protein LOC106169383 [Lingula anatina]|eukprot:XP_013404285.1 uncharacterized protein LOC106169383 [Lingula anatina]
MGLSAETKTKQDQNCTTRMMASNTGSYNLSPSQQQLCMIKELYSMSNIEWDDQEIINLKDFTSKHLTPHIVRVEQGQFMNIGASKHIHPGIHTELLFHSTKTCSKIFAQGVKVKDRKVSVLTQNFSIPSTYQGWFEVLSEEGRSVPPFDTVRDLARRFPKKALVRANTKGYINNERGELCMDKTRTVHAGEVLTVAGDVMISLPKGKGRAKLLRCFDQNGSGVYLNFDTKGAFSPIAERDNISGVHMINDLVAKFRLPIMVRLVYGVAPCGSKLKFTGCLRLISSDTDSIAFVMPLDISQKMLPVSLSKVSLKLRPATNIEKIKQQDAFKQLYERCSNMITSYLNSIHVLVEITDFQSNHQQQQQQQQQIEPGSAVYKPKELTNPDVIPTNVPPESPDVIQEEKAEPKPSAEDLIFEEIDDIYVYVREGGPPPKVRPPAPLPANVKADDQYWEEPDYETLARYNAKNKVSQTNSSGTGSKSGGSKNLSRQNSSESQPVVESKVTANGIVLLGIDKQKDKQQPPPLPPKKFEKSKSSAPHFFSRFVKKSTKQSPPSSQKQPQKFILVPPGKKQASRKLSKDMRTRSHDSIAEMRPPPPIPRLVTHHHHPPPTGIFRLDRPDRDLRKSMFL